MYILRIDRISLFWRIATRRIERDNEASFEQAGHLMAPIRIALASLPQLLHDIVVASLSSEPDMEIVGEASGPEQLSAVVRESSADVAIAACERSEVASLGRLINGSPSTLLAITDEGRRGALYELCPQETDLGEISPRQLVNAIRGVVKKTAT